MGELTPPATLSVVMPTYNGARYVAQALESLKQQSVPLLEIVLIDDGSDDDTLSIARSFKNSLNLHFLSNEKVGNWVTNTNRGISEARGDYIAILHQDDLWRPNRHQTFLETVGRFPEIDVFVNCSHYIDSDGRIIGQQRFPLAAGNIYTGEEILPTLVVQNYISFPSVIFRKSLVDSRRFPMDERFWYTADWNLWLSLCEGSHWYLDGSLLTDYRIHEESLTFTGKVDGEYAKQLNDVPQAYFPLLAKLSPKDFPDIKKRSVFSQELNFRLASFFCGNRSLIWGMIPRGFALGPRNLLLYFRESRIVERIIPRLRLLFLRPIKRLQK